MPTSVGIVSTHKERIISTLKLDTKELLHRAKLTRDVLQTAKQAGCTSFAIVWEPGVMLTAKVQMPGQVQEWVFQSDEFIHLMRRIEQYIASVKP